MKEGTIAARYEDDRSDRNSVLQRARRAAALTNPTILKDIEGDDRYGAYKSRHDGHYNYPQAFTSIGQRGLNIMAGKMLSALFPTTQPWFQFKVNRSVAEQLAGGGEGPRAALAEMEARLFTDELMVATLIEGNGIGDETSRQRMGFRGRKRTAIEQLLVTGDVLEQLTDDYRLKVFSRDKYVTRRDSAGSVLYHIVQERIDPLALTEDQLAAIDETRQDLESESPAKRLVEIYTMVEWQPQSRSWVQRQEINGHTVPTQMGEEAIEHDISPYFSTTYGLGPDEDYGRGFVEINVLGTLGTLNELELRLLDMMDLASLNLVAADYNARVNLQDLKKPTGSVVRTKVVGGQVDDVGVLSLGNVSDFQSLTLGIERKAREVAQTMLIESATQPNKDRVTATQVERIADEIDGALGGTYTVIAEEQQRPLLRRAKFQMDRDGISQPLPTAAELRRLGAVIESSVVDIDILTGVSALQRDASASKMLNLVEVLGAFGQEGLSRIDIGQFAQQYMKYRTIDSVHIVKSEQKLAEERQEAMRMMAQQQAIESAGAIAETSAQAAAQQGTQT